jgi:death on curing protein
VIERLSLEDLHEALTALGCEGLVRDRGLLESALAQPFQSVCGQDAYPDVHLKAAAVLRAVQRNHPLIDGNKRLVLVAALFVLADEDWICTASQRERADLVLSVADHTLDDVERIADWWHQHTRYLPPE